MGNAKPFRFTLDTNSGVPVYRQLIDQVLLAMASGALESGSQLPTVRQLAVDLSINPNTVVRAYKELEIRGILATQQGTGTFLTHKKVKQDETLRRRRLTQMVSGFLSQAGGEGFSLDEIHEILKDWMREKDTGGKQ
ncbi:MAG TPA: GntR family transcriptional regulator [Bryobacteraceae bacterium]|nr:GntR family transcriptional regulator [Bryobacteraceae bacterium]